MKIGGLDIGTTGCKLTVFDEAGNCLAKEYQDYPVVRRGDAHEVDVSVIMDAVYGVIQRMTEQFHDIAGIGVTSFGETFVMTDEAGNPLHTALLYTDPRGAVECAEIVQVIGAQKLAEITGLRAHEMYSISKMMWIRKHKPEVFRQAKRVFLMEDYVVFHLTGIAQIDYSLASRTMAFDIRELCWNKEVFTAAGIEMTLMSTPVPAGTDAGEITDEVAAKTGLDKSTHIISVSHDQAAAAIGAGAFDSTTAVDGAGTVECLTLVFDELPDVKTMYDGCFSIVPYAIPGKYITYAFTYTGGALIQWCTEILAKKEQELAEQQRITVNEYLERESNSPTGLLVLPHFAGAATPYMDTGSKGAVVGMTMATTVADIYRACMEGVTYEMYLNREALKGEGTSFAKLHATGGGAHSKEWMQMKADVLDLPITALKTVDAGTVGSAMMTGVAMGCFQNLEEAAQVMIEETETYFPQPDMHQQYMNIYQRYEKLYQAVRPLVAEE